ncbi:MULTISPECIES: hypothetical protein [Proteus]|uniref:Uncharacterized protein n=1 Tax=Proteus vulgaris TaxID=585 RepID=A0A379F8R9_PROVU|nr:MULTISPECIES: hypothetical protein [Proteus]NBN58730.1 hypothetical protein [Proteus sp. G2639]RNT24845.1 hypothetical protein B9475_013880 [Proteus mirabilis]AYY82471.1 hypothetical protein EGX81_17000 [Proteus vulgaris]KGA56941.1 hypothetical protein DR95_3162 [Proteus vulgaris]MBG5970408.1 hypothetical protein [Proteus vulgaris]
MYDDISNLKDKFQEDAFAFQEFSSSPTQDVDNKVEPIVISNEDNNKMGNLSNKTFSESSSSSMKNEQKQSLMVSSNPSYRQDALVVKAKKDNLIKSKKNLLADNKIFDNKETDRVYAHENISLKDIFSFIASV